MSDKKTVIHWFRKGLRIHDNPALTSAVNETLEDAKRKTLRPIFVLDPGITKWLKVKYFSGILSVSHNLINYFRLVPIVGDFFKSH